MHLNDCHAFMRKKKKLVRKRLPALKLTMLLLLSTMLSAYAPGIRLAHILDSDSTFNDCRYLHIQNLSNLNYLQECKKFQAEELVNEAPPW